MKYIISISLCMLCVTLFAQKPFQEGVIEYKVTMVSADNQAMNGVYIFTIKGAEIKKELKLENGYDDIMLVNCATGAVYSLQTKNGKKYAIQLSMSDLSKRQEKYANFALSNEQPCKNNVAGLAAYKSNIRYKDGTTAELCYTKEWNPSQGITFERFPAPKFLPLSFSYTNESGISFTFEALKVEAGPVENAVFRIPPDYKMISYKEYKELSQ